jgi:hypothetical protein
MDSPLGELRGLSGSLLVQLCIAGAQLAFTWCPGPGVQDPSKSVLCHAACGPSWPNILWLTSYQVVLYARQCTSSCRACVYMHHACLFAARHPDVLMLIHLLPRCVLPCQCLRSIRHWALHCSALHTSLKPPCYVGPAAALTQSLSL